MTKEKLNQSRKRFTKIKTVLKVFKYAKLRKQHLIILLALSGLSTLLKLVPAYMMKPLTDKVFAPATPSSAAERIQELNVLIFVLLAAYIIQTLVNYVVYYQKQRLGYKIGLNIRKELYVCLQRLSMRFHGLEKAGALESRISYDTQAIESFLSAGIIPLFINLVMFVGIGVVLFYLEWRLALVLLVPIPLLIILFRVFGKKIVLACRKLHKRMADMSSVVFSAVSGILVVKINVAEKKELSKFVKASKDVFLEKIRLAKLQSLFQPSTAFVVFAAAVTVRWIGGLRLIQKELTLGELMVFIGYMMLFYGPVTGISWIYERYQNAVAAGERILKVLDAESEIRDAPNPVDLPRIRGSVVFDNVGFNYDGNKNVLEGINLEIAPGEIIGITGPSGGGKTTMVSLLCRLYDVTSGTIAVDGYDIRNIKKELLRRHIGVVLQETLLFYGTIAENITYGVTDTTRIQIINAAKDAGAHNFIVRLPDAYDTLIGERGIGLSAGERQRICIARVLLKAPKIIVFDEATSSVDLETEALIQATIQELAKECTIFIVSHKLSMLSQTNKLAVLDNGKLAEIGTYDSLSKAGGLFSRLRKEKEKENIKKRNSGNHVI